MKDVLVIGIAGGSGSGKTTLARNISDYFADRISILRHDDYYRAQDDIPMEVRVQTNYDHPHAFDTELLLSHLDALREGHDVDSPIYDYTNHTRSGEVRHVKASAVILLEGILILENKEVRDRLDMKIFVDTDADVRIVRRIMRDVKKRGRSLESVTRQYLTTVKPMHEAFVEPSKRYADIIIPEGGKNPVACGTIIDRIERHLSGD
ncbi:MAG: uridine kinase [Ruminococcaceae bacterium]|nr:uridine kinase [Oscillospiraceae bacterium]